MKYLFFSLLNGIYGFMLLFSITSDMPGVTLIIFTGGILAVLGVTGFGLWIWQTVTSIKEKPSNVKNLLISWWSITRGIDILLVLGLLFRFFVLQPYVIEGPSMNPNYYDREYILVNQMSYRLHLPARGETVVFKYPLDPKEEYIKRIIGLPGETVEIKNGKVYVNEKSLLESYLADGEVTLVNSNIEEKFKTTLKSNEYFVMGDNRNHSSDSRTWGILPKNNIIGKAWFVIYPLQYKGLVKIPQF